jgi:intracellular sulfur oxidation DsrE/DsrF family protein
MAHAPRARWRPAGISGRSRASISQSTNLELEMTTSRSSRVALLCAGIILAGCALASDAQTETPAAPSVPSAQSAPAPQKVAQKTEKTAQKKVAKSDAAAMHKVAIQVSQNDKAAMDVALNNVRNITEYYKQKGETVAIEVVTYGPGLHMLRADTSPVKDRIAPMALENPSVTFIACGNTQTNQSKAEGKPVALLSEAKVVPSGVVRLMELQTQGYAYIRP